MAEVDVGAVHDVLHVRFKELQKVRAVRGGDAGAFLELLEQWRCDLEIDERDCTPIWWRSTNRGIVRDRERGL